MKAPYFQSSKQKDEILTLEKFGGINLSSTPSQINQTQSPDMLNMHADERGVLHKRTGYKRLFAQPIAAANVNGLFEFNKSNGQKELLIAVGPTLYRRNADNTLTTILGGLANARLEAFFMGGKMYFMNGTDYFSYDGSATANITPYIPTLFISKTPGDGGGTPFEDFNLLGAGFKESFSGDGVAKVFKLSLTNLDSTPITGTVDNQPMVEGTNFTADRVTGTITFNGIPAKGTNNITVTAYKTQANLPNMIKNCRFNVLYGGSNDTRVFVSGNPNYKNRIWRSDLHNPAYFPENGFYQIGADNEAITGFSKQYDTLIIEKERSKATITYTLAENGLSSFPSKPLNDQIGTTAPKSIQIIENNPVSLTRTGVHMLVQSNVRDERNVQHISSNVDARLLAETNLEAAISVDFQRKYWLAINGRVYIYDYAIGEWYIYDNIPATCFIIYENNLYFGTNNGLVYRFSSENESNPYMDDTTPINAYWTSKYMSFEAEHLKKNVDRIFFSIRPAAQTSVDVYYETNKKISELIKTKSAGRFSFLELSFPYFSFNRSVFPQPFAVRFKAKKITHFQLRLVNNKPYESLGLLSLAIKFSYGSQVK